jgi:ABC-2 type transport system permease protein
MAGSIFKEVLRRSWRQIIYWGIGIALLIVYIATVLGDSEMLAAYTEMVAKMPTGLMEMFGLNPETLGSVEGYLAWGVFSYTALIIAVYAVIAGLNVTANEEDSGIMDVLLSLPVPRWRVVIEKLAAFTVMLLGIVAIGFVAMVLAMQTTDYYIGVGQLLQSFLNMIPISLFVMAFTAFVSALVRGRNTAAAIATAFVIASYFIDSIGGMLGGDFADALGRLSIFHYFDPEPVLLGGLVWTNVLGLLAAAALLLGGTQWAFNRREVGL